MEKKRKSSAILFFLGVAAIVALPLAVWGLASVWKSAADDPCERPAVTLSPAEGLIVVRTQECAVRGLTIVLDGQFFWNGDVPATGDEQKNIQLRQFTDRTTGDRLDPGAHAVIACEYSVENPPAAVGPCARESPASYQTDY